MREILYIRLRDPVRETSTYAIVNADAPASIFVREAPLDEILQQATGRRIVLTVPAGTVRLTQIDVPTRQPVKALQAAPFMLEDQIAEDVDQVHFALGPRRGTNTWPVALTARADMEAWLAPLRAVGLMPDSVIPETLCLPPPEDDAWYALAEPGQIIVRSTAYGGFCCTHDDLPLYLQIAAGDETAPPPLRIMVAPDVGTDFSALNHPVELRAGYTDPFEALIRHHRPEQAIDLLQGQYSRREGLARLWRPWRMAAALAAAVFLVAVSNNVIWALRLQREAQAQATTNAQRFHQLFPQEPTSLDISLALQQV